MTRWIRVTPGNKETGTAAAASAIVALGVGAVTFYLVRALLSREEVRPLALSGPSPEAIEPADAPDV